MSTSKKKTDNPDIGLSFEEALTRLEQIIEKLETGQASLDESLALFEEGVRLSRYCGGKLEEIERKIEVLTGGKDEDDQPTAEPFDAEGID
jgi:exodeoxyribonuclease VII small subunit